MTGEESRELRAEATVAVPPERVWALLSDFSRLPQWSPETVRMLPLKPGGQRVGQWYLGINRRGRVWWPSRSVLTGREEGRRLAWDTRTSGARWIWELEADGAGTRIVHRRPVTGRPVGARVFARLFLGGLAHHVDELEDDMQLTVDRLAAAAAV
ncbi:SRPBCC family protein [Nocardioides panacisoli]|uniref:SRPBCC family protein n=1 Tax=Nocardioides panacisoli TaxID=627624 RepID=UPI001C634920|nr:SRPBCC family protein [Nocardioides panacisoli]QYJ04359.1 SRPBCC family protein [Nocardioides panacisoli]